MLDKCVDCGASVELVSKDHWHGFLDTDYLVCHGCGASMPAHRCQSFDEEDLRRDAT